MNGERGKIYGSGRKYGTLGGGERRKNIAISLVFLLSFFSLMCSPQIEYS
jgi:hypothetical protein